MDEPTSDNTTRTQEHLLQLRDRIIKIETIINYHDKEFRDVKAGLADLADTVERQQFNILERLEEYNKQALDVTYEQYRDNAKVGTDLATKITAVDTKFDNFIKKWRAVSLAVWFTLVIVFGAAAWVITTGANLGVIEVKAPIVLVEPDQATTPDQKDLP